MSSGNRTHPVATAAEICLRIGTIFAAVGCLIIWYCGLVVANPDNVALMSYKIWGLRIAFSGSLYMVFAPVVRFTYTKYLWRHHFILITIGLLIMLNTHDALEKIQLFNTPTSFFIFTGPFLVFLIFGTSGKRTQVQ